MGLEKNSVYRKELFEFGVIFHGAQKKKRMVKEILELERRLATRKLYLFASLQCSGVCEEQRVIK